MQETLWNCDKCGRQFSKRGQWHSCVSFSVEDLFEGKPRPLKHISHDLLNHLRKFGSIRVDAVKSGIDIAGRSHFAMVQVLSDGLRRGFAAKRPIHNPRILRSETVLQNQYVHPLKLRSPSDIDAELLT